MSSFEFTRLEDGRYKLDGDVSFATAESVLRASRDMFTGQSDVEVDLSAVRKTDSAGLALLLEWISLAQQSGTDIRFNGIPEKIHAIAQTAEIEELLAPDYSTSSSK